MRIIHRLADRAPAPDGPLAAPWRQVRLKDVAALDGVRPVPLLGYGLVVGLNKTGDRRQTIFSAQTLANMLERFGVAVAGGEIKIENIAAVLVTAELPPFARPGARIDVTASSVGDARSLQGGTLLATALRGPDGAVYALAQGPLSIGGFGGGKGGNTVQVNHLTVGRVPGGALVQAGQGAQMGPAERILLTLKDADFSTAHRVADADHDRARRRRGPGHRPRHGRRAGARRIPDVDPRSDGPARAAAPCEVDAPARVVINERTGTVVVGSDVRIGRAAVAHGNLSVRITTKFDVSQPGALSSGQTTVVPQEKVDVDGGRGPARHARGGRHARGRGAAR